jgi:K+-sensing histidine kinase KdpD
MTSQMAEPRFADALTVDPPPLRVGVGAAVLGVVSVTALIYPLKDAVPAPTAVMLYLPVVLVVSIFWGLWVGFATSVASTVCFNFFHIPPVGRFDIAHSQDLVAIAMFFVVAVLASAVADAARSAARHRERLRGELVEAEAVRRSDQLKTALLRSVSHDLRSPLTGISTAAEALESSNLSDSDRVQLIGDVRDGARRLSELIDKLLDVSRLQAGVVVPRTDWCSLDEIVRSAEDSLSFFDIPGVDNELGMPLVRVDAAQLERALTNLLENAARHGGGADRVCIHRVDDFAAIDVIDHGPGISPDRVDAMFEPFTGTGGDSGGAGLGLAIVRGFIEANHGHVSYFDSEGGGATFRIALPLENEPGSPAPSAPLDRGVPA